MCACECQREWSLHKLCNSSATNQPGLTRLRQTGLCKFSSIHICIMQTPNEQNANVCYIHTLPHHKSKLSTWKSDVKVIQVVTYLLHNVAPKIGFFCCSQRAGPHPVTFFSLSLHLFFCFFGRLKAQSTLFLFALAWKYHHSRPQIHYLHFVSTEHQNEWRDIFYLSLAHTSIG